MAPSIGFAVSDALQRTKVILFKPFDLGKWFLLGFCAFLAQCDAGGGGGVGNIGNWGGGPGGGPGRGADPLRDALDWIGNNIALVSVVGVSALLLLVALTALILWLASRGKFMFIDGLAHNRGAVVEPWQAFAGHANSLFGFLLVLSVVGLLVTLALLASGVAIAWPDIQAAQFGSAGLLAVIVAGGGLLVLTLAFALIRALVIDFVVPTMYVFDVRVLDGIQIARRELWAGNVGVIVLFYLMKILLGIAVGFIAVAATCMTCCLTAVPYLGTVVLLPLLVFMQCYTLCFITQFGPRWRIFVDRICGHCGYDLRGLPAGSVCPECGAPTSSTTDRSAPPLAE